MVPNRISQGANCIIQDQQVLVLVFPKGKNQSIKDKAKIWNQLSAGLFFKGGKCTEIKVTELVKDTSHTEDRSRKQKTGSYRTVASSTPLEA